MLSLNKRCDAQAISSKQEKELSQVLAQQMLQVSPHPFFSYQLWPSTHGASLLAAPA